MAFKFRPHKLIFWTQIARWPYNKLLDAPAVFDDPDALFPARKELLENFETVRDEAIKLAYGPEIPAYHELLPQQKHMLYDSDNIRWNIAVLRAYSVTVPRNMERLPCFADFVARHPEVVSAAISIFPPSKHLPPHKGPFRGVLRYHLGLMVEHYDDGTTSAQLNIDEKTYYVREGGDLLWDDTFRHEAFNRSDDKPRIVLLLDVNRPDAPWILRMCTNIWLFVAGIGIRLHGFKSRAALP